MFGGKGDSKEDSNESEEESHGRMHLAS